MRDSEFRNAYNQFQKAYLLYQSDQIKEMLFNSSLLVVTKSEYETSNEMKVLAQLLRFENNQIGASEVAGEFGRVTQRQLLSNNDTVLYKDSYQLLRSELEDVKLIKDIDLVFNYEMARILFNRGNYSLALPYAMQAYELKPENADNESLLLNCFVKEYGDKTPKESLVFFEKLMTSNEFIKSNNHFGSVWLNLNLEVMFDELQDRKLSEGLKFKKQFEELVQAHPQYKYDHYLVGRAYSQAVVYYFKRGQMTNARRVLNEGLNYAPNNSELKSRKYMINR